MNPRSFLPRVSLRPSVRLARTVAIASLAVALPLGVSSTFAGQRRQGGFANAPVQTPPTPDYDLLHVAVTLDVDVPNKAMVGSTTQTLKPRRGALSALRFHAGEKIMVDSATVDGAPASVSRDGVFLVLTPAAAVAANKTASVVIRYHVGGLQGGGFLGGAGWHWINPQPGGDPNRIGFWTQGEAEGNRTWVPIWDYPNDFTTTETTVTVPAGWNVIGNGVLASEKTVGDRSTFHWKMDLPHATYLLSLAAGPLDIKKARWEGVDLWYVVPRGKGDLIDASFDDTPDMLAFYSKTFGVKYPWPKYAQDAMYDFGGGMENVSATTLGEGSLTDFRSGYRNMSSLNCHELGHQWFGDYVTCQDWGQAWLNESFATYCECLYFEHRDGEFAYDREVQSNISSYLNEARRYKRAIVTNRYPNPDAMFDQHTYPKGGAVLHTLRRYLGDPGFFGGIRLYLARHAHQPVDTMQLCQAFSDASKIDCKPFFNQWLYKPGHPMIDFSWTWDDAAHEVVATIKQVQDTSDGTPIYLHPVSVGLIGSSGMVKQKVTMNAAEQVVRFKMNARPAAVLFDPGHDMLKEMAPTSMAIPDDGLLAVFRYAPCAIDRLAAMRRLLADNPSDAVVKEIADAVGRDNKIAPAYPSVVSLVNLNREDLRPLWRAQLAHPNPNRRTEAVRALGRLSSSPADLAAIKKLVNPTEYYAPLLASLDVLSRWDPKGSVATFVAATKIDSNREIIRIAAYPALVAADARIAGPILVEGASAARPQPQRLAALRAMERVPLGDTPTSTALRAALKDTDWRVVLAAANTLVARKETDTVSSLKALADNPPAGAPAFFATQLRQLAERLEGGS